MAILSIFTGLLIFFSLLPYSQGIRPGRRNQPNTNIGPQLPEELTSGVYKLAVGTSCPTVLILQTTGEPATTASLALDGNMCSGTPPVFEGIRRKRRDRHGRKLPAALSASLPTPLSCGAQTMPQYTKFLYVSTDGGTRVSHERTLLSLLRRGPPIQGLVELMRQGDGRPGKLLAASTGCMWRRVGALDGETLEALASPDVQVENTGAPGKALYAQTGDEKESNCFPASARVRLADGSDVPMSALRTGAAVADVASPAQRGGDRRWSRVLLWTHRDHGAWHRFVRIATGGAGRRPLVLSRGHLVYADGHAVPAASVVTGMALQGVDGEKLPVERVDSVWMRGLYNPQTGSGDIVVEGVRCTTYTTAVPAAAAHALLAPVRAVCGMGAGVAGGVAEWAAWVATRGGRICTL